MHLLATQCIIDKNKSYLTLDFLFISTSNYKDQQKLIR